MTIAAFDVSKHSLQFSVGGRIGALDNDLSDFGPFLRELPSDAIVAMEATNKYHRGLADAAHSMGFRVHVVSPRRASMFARSTNARGKTDRQDASSLEMFVRSQEDHLHVYIPPSEEVQRVRDLLSHRLLLVKSKTALFLGLWEEEDIRKLALSGIEQSIKRVDEELQQILSMFPEYALLQTVPGVGKVVAAGLLAPLLCFDFISSDAFVAYLGLDPRPQDSGKKEGVRRLAKQGYAEGRRLAYLAAMQGLRRSPWSDYAAPYRARGFQGTKLTVVVARKLVRVAWSVFKFKQPFDPSRLTRSS